MSNSTNKIPISIAYGDGIGPEIAKATRAILEAAETPLEYEEVLLGEKVFLAGNTVGIAPEAWDSIRRTKVLLKGPITTPQGGGYKSINVTLRKSFGLFANVRPCVAYHPFIPTNHPFMNIVIVRENEEDLYAGIEHRQTQEVEQCLKLFTRQGCERIARYAFEYARQQKRHKVTCFTKDNIMKQTDGLFHRVFDEIGEEYPNITKDHMIIDIGAAKLAASPDIFDVIVMPNLYGDIASDIAAQIAGSVGLAGSANIGNSVSMFEAIHGSAPDIAGQGIANPSGMLMGAVLMLHHLDLSDKADLIQNAWLRTLEEGIHTGDILSKEQSKRRVGTQEFAEAVIERLGSNPLVLKAATHDESEKAIQLIKPSYPPSEEKKLVGVDVFVAWAEGDRDPEELAAELQKHDVPEVQLSAMTNRGIRVWPKGLPETLCSDHWRCRFLPEEDDAAIAHSDVIGLLDRMAKGGIDFIKTEHLYTFSGKKGFSSIPGV